MVKTFLSPPIQGRPDGEKETLLDAILPCWIADLTLLDRPAAEDLKMEDPSWSDKLAPEFPWRVIDVVAAVRLEMARTVDDVLSRRTRMTFLDEMAAARCTPQVEAILQQELGPAR
ncbi:MAG: hypothetical protein KDM64_07260 [Verrucomicrobiae bacterium]|nr:hypothetical protein [Verrucomicrobiae bacterium]